MFQSNDYGLLAGPDECEIFVGNLLVKSFHLPTLGISFNFDVPAANDTVLIAQNAAMRCARMLTDIDLGLIEHVQPASLHFTGPSKCIRGLKCELYMIIHRPSRNSGVDLNLNFSGAMFGEYSDENAFPLPRYQVILIYNDILRN